MIRANLKQLYCPDLPNLEEYIPPQPERFGLFVQAMFGPEGSEGEESFDIVICTPGWLEEQVRDKGILIGRHHLIVKDYDLNRIRTFLIKYAETCLGETWDAVAEKLARLGHWEFEDYSP